MNKKKIQIDSVAQIIDHTLLVASATQKDIEKICHEAIEHGFRAVCVNQTWVKFCSGILGHNSNILVAAVVDFPLGAGNLEQKRVLSEIVKKEGATEIDVVMNMGKFLDGKYKEVAEELRVVSAILPTKVIIETGYLNDGQILKATELVDKSGANFIKTSTGWEPKVDIKEKARQVKLIRDNFPRLKIKAAGGIKTMADLELMLESGANIVGASESVVIAKESEKEKKLK